LLQVFSNCGNENILNSRDFSWIYVFFVTAISSMISSKFSSAILNSRNYQVFELFKLGVKHINSVFSRVVHISMASSNVVLGNIGGLERLQTHKALLRVRKVRRKFMRLVVLRGYFLATYFAFLPLLGSLSTWGVLIPLPGACKPATERLMSASAEVIPMVLVIDRYMGDLLLVPILRYFYFLIKNTDVLFIL
jgi:hypothetical protein